MGSGLSWIMKCTDVHYGTVTHPKLKLKLVTWKDEFECTLHVGRPRIGQGHSSVIGQIRSPV